MSQQIYDADFRYRALVKGIDESLFRWGRAQPMLGTIAESIKSWKNDLSALSYHPQFRVSAFADSLMAMDDAWENRANRSAAMKSLGDAIRYLKQVGEQRPVETHQPGYRRNAMKALVGEEALKRSAVKSTNLPYERVVEEWRDEARRQLEHVQHVPQHSGKYIAYSPNQEGGVYRHAILRAKSWLESNYDNVARLMTDESRQAVKAVEDHLNQIEQNTRNGLMDSASRRRVHVGIRQAIKSLEVIQPNPRPPRLKSDIFGDVTRLRARLDGMMPMLANGNYDDQDLLRDVSEVMSDARGLYRAAPIKAMPADTFDNFNNLGLSLQQIVETRRHDIRVKALRAAAANMDIIAKDLAALEGQLRQRESETDANKLFG